ncbi:MAG: phosphoenolpyruvate--protein phosphotransferase [Herbinix sp.]|nr:phosphoenolpyruvate--protein phosphotransferase [Herbinix sp.]
MMKSYEGKSAYNGIAIGNIKLYKKDNQIVNRKHIDDVKKEQERFEEAKAEAVKQLQSLYEKALKEVGAASAAIFDVQQMMLEDVDYLASIYNIIETQKVNAEYAVAVTGDNFSSMFATLEDDYMKERAADVKDVSERLLSAIGKKSSSNFDLTEPSIILAEDLAPSETVQLDKEKVLAFVTVRGSTNSHTAILARMMSIPALVNTKIDLEDGLTGKIAIVNGNTGEFIVEPDEQLLAEVKKVQEEEQEKRYLLQTLKGKDNITLDGQKINLYANIGSLSDLASVLQNDAGGIGLFRSEFLYLERDTYPTEEEQFQVYKQVAETMAGKKIIIRTLDIGADKQVDYFELEKEENPAMGYRAIRICLDRIEVFKTQLKAIFRASAFGNIAIMYPMIISVEEIYKIKEVVAEVKAELSKNNVTIGKVEQGIMIETPAAVMISDLLAKEVDFFSIGTNDLSQYTLAIDRMNQKLENFFNPHHEAVLRMIRMVVENGHKEGIWIGICGELGADLSLTKTFLEMGIDELSVAPPYILPLRAEIRKLNIKN